MEYNTSQKNGDNGTFVWSNNKLTPKNRFPSTGSFDALPWKTRYQINN